MESAATMDEIELVEWVKRVKEECCIFRTKIHTTIRGKRRNEEVNETDEVMRGER